MAKKLLSLILVFIFLTQSVLPASAAVGSAYGGGYAQESSARLLNASGSLALITNLPVLKYLSLNPANPNNYFNFLLDSGANLRGSESFPTSEVGLTTESRKLINYFFLGLTLPLDAFWVNLQPNQEDKLTSQELAKTDLGRVLLEQDLKLKKDIANYLNPKNEIGRQFWTALYQKIGGGRNTNDEIRKTNITTNNRVWIVPEKSVVVETEDGALITEAKLKVMLESEYFEHLRGGQDSSEVDKVKNDQVKQISESLMKEIIIPAITKDVNESPGYAPLRQIYHSLILAQYFKKRHNSLNSQNSPNSPNSMNSCSSYLNSGKTQGLESQAPWSKDAIYQDYLKSYTQGEYKFIDKTIFNLKRMYFSGGIIVGDMLAGASPIMKVISKGSPDKIIVENPVLKSNLDSSSPVLAEGSIVNGKIAAKIITTPGGIAGKSGSNKELLTVKYNDRVAFNIYGIEGKGTVLKVTEESGRIKYEILPDGSTESVPFYVKQEEIVEVLTSLPIDKENNFASSSLLEEERAAKRNLNDADQLAGDGNKDEAVVLYKKAAAFYKKVIDMLKSSQKNEVLKKEALAYMYVMNKNLTMVMDKIKTLESVDRRSNVLDSVSLKLVGDIIKESGNGRMKDALSAVENAKSFFSLPDVSASSENFYFHATPFESIINMLLEGRLWSEKELFERNERIRSGKESGEIVEFSTADFEGEEEENKEKERNVFFSKGKFYEGYTDRYGSHSGLMIPANFIHNQVLPEERDEALSRSVGDEVSFEGSVFVASAMFLVDISKEEKMKDELMEKLRLRHKDWKDARVLARADKLMEKVFFIGKDTTLGETAERMFNHKEGRILVSYFFQKEVNEESASSAIEGKNGSEDKVSKLKQDFFQKLGLGVMGLTLDMEREGLGEIDDVFKKYDSEYDVVVIDDKIMPIIGKIAGLENGAAFNFNGIIVVTDTVLQKSRAGDKESLFMIKHEHRHNDYRDQHGDGLKFTVEQKLVDEMYAYFSSFVDVYGEKALKEEQDRDIGKGSWWQIVSMILVRDYIKGAFKDLTGEREKEELILKITAASLIIDALCAKKGAKIFLEYLKMIDSLEQILAIISKPQIENLMELYAEFYQKSDPNWQTTKIDLKNYDIFHNNYQKHLNKSASSPADKKGGIDLNNIEITLKDEKFVSNLNPADYKILLATKALREGSSPLSLLRVHEAMGLLKSDIVKSIRNRGLLIQLLNQLQSRKSLDPQGMQFLHFIQNKKSTISPA